MLQDRLGQTAAVPQAADGWRIDTIVAPSALTGANGMRWGADGQLYVAQAFGSQISAVDVASGTARVVSPADGAVIGPDDLAFDTRGNLFVTEVMSARVSAIAPNGTVSVIASNVPVANGITVHEDRIFMSEFNPEGRIWELFPDGAAPRLIASNQLMPNALCLGPDGMLYYPLVPLGEVWRVNVAGGVPERVIGGLNTPTAVKFDAAGRLFAVESGSGEISLIDVATGTRTCFARVAYGIDNFAFAPDGRMYVSHFTDGEVIELAPDGAQRVAVAGGMTGPFGLAVNRQGELLVADGMSLAVVDGSGAVSRPGMLLQHGFPGYVRGVAAGMTGEFIVTNSAGQCARYQPGGEAEVLADGLEEAMGVIVRSAGDVVLCEAAAGRVIAIGADGTTRVLASGLDRPTGLAEAPDGGLFISEAGAGRLCHLDHDGVRVVLAGLDQPHGVTVAGGRAVVLDRGAGTLCVADGHGSHYVIASGLPVGAHSGMKPNVLPGIADLMPGPLLPFADLATLPDGRIALGADDCGAMLTVGAAT